MRDISSKTTKSNNQPSTKSESHKVCASSKAPNVTGARDNPKPPLKSRISFAEASKVAKPSRASLGSSQTKTTGKNLKGGPHQGSHERVKSALSNKLESDNLYRQIKQFLEENKFAIKSQNVDSRQDHKHSDSSIHFVLLGDVTKPLPHTSRVVRVFTSSTFTDTMLERNMLLEKTFPRIKLFCQARGYDFQVVDMRWGVRDESTDDHMGTELCLKELIQCRDMSTGPFFVTLLSHKYGYCSLPREIEASEFEKLLKCVKDKNNIALLEKWYIRDDNSVPTVYVLQSISKNLPDFLSPEIEKKLAAKSKWWEDNDAMQGVLYAAAVKALGEKGAEKYVISVTEKELKAGLLDTTNPNKHCLWFKRNIRGIEQAEPSKLVSRFTECLGSPEKIKKSKILIADLKEKKIPKILSSENICTYDIDWTDKGIDPNNGQHMAYLEKMTADFEKHICQLIERGIQEREQGKNDVLFEECLQHLRFAHEKSKKFHGRVDDMKKIEQYLLFGADFPLVVHGESGSGKTSIMAQTAMMTGSTAKDKVVVIRFIGTTPRSSNISSLLKSICHQIKNVYGDTSVTSEDPKELVYEFQRCLQDLPTKDKELIILLDSMDQLDPAHQGRQLGWMPTSIPKHVKFIVSTLEDEKYECFPAIKFLYRSSKNYIAVEKLPEDDVKCIIDSWLKGKNRTLTEFQKDLLLRSFDQCPLPLNLKLSFDEACKWTSFATRDSTRLQMTIRDSINRLFFRLERMHGELFVSRTLGYITAAKNGLSEGEMEDILACDDDVLNDVYTYWTPPLRRLPPLLLIRLKADLSEYIVERGADGLTVIYWYHRQFVQAARERYCQNTQILHEALADFFSGKWSNGNKKPCKDKSGKSLEEDRFISSQPLMFGSKFNLRKLNNLPFHRIKADQMELAKKECLCNFKFMFCKLLATSCSNLLSDYTLAAEGTNDKAVNLIRDTLQLSEHALIFDKMLLVPQLIDRLSTEKTAASFLSQMKDYPFSYLLTHYNTLMKPGGSLVYSLTGHFTELMAVDMKQDGSTAVTCAKYPDNSIRLWDVKNGKLIKSIENIAERAVRIFFICNDSLILAHFYHKLVALRETGEVVYTISTASERILFCPADRGRVIFLIFQDNTIECYDAQSGKKTDTITCPEGVRFSATGVAVGSKSLVVATVEPREKFIVFDLMTKNVSLYDVPYPNQVNRRHIIKSLAIMPNERHVIFSIRFNNDIRFLDTSTMKEDRVIKGDPGDFTLGQFLLSPDGTELFYQVAQSVCVWNLKKEHYKRTFLHPGYVLGLASTDWKTMVTISNDPIVRVWDLTKKMKYGDLTKVRNLAHMYDYKSLSNPRYLLGLAQLRQEENYAVVTIDMATRDVIRKCQLNEKPRLFDTLNDREVVLCSSDRKIKVVDVDKMEVTRSFQGEMFQHIPFTPYGYQEIAILKERGELVTVTKGRKHFKIYDISSGRTKSIVRCTSQEDHRLKGLKACHDGSVVIAYSTVHKFYVLDTVNSKLLAVIGEADFKCLKLFEFVHVTSSGNVALFFPNFTTDSSWSFQLYKIREGKVGVKLTDNGYPESLTTEAKKFAVPNARSIEDWGFVTSYLDNLIRIWDSEKGTILHRLSGHVVPVTIPPLERGIKYFLTHSRLREENAIRVWDIQTMQCVASYKHDGSENCLTDCCGDLKSFYSIQFSPVYVNHFSLKGLGCDVDLATCPELYKGTGNKTIDLSVPTPHPDDVQDPDDDPDEEDEFHED